MKEILRSLLESRGIQIHEKEYEILAAKWSSYEQLRTNVEQIGLDGSNMVLLQIPNGGAQQ